MEGSPWVIWVDPRSPQGPDKEGQGSRPHGRLCGQGKGPQAQGRHRPQRLGQAEKRVLPGTLPSEELGTPCVAPRCQRTSACF